MEHIAIGGEIICKGGWQIVVFDFNVNINDKWSIQLAKIRKKPFLLQTY